MRAHGYKTLLSVFLLLLCALAPGKAQETAPPSDPFAGVTAAAPKPAATGASSSWFRRLVTDNLGFRKEIMSQFDTDETGSRASRQSVGFEILKKFSTATSTAHGSSVWAWTFGRGHELHELADGAGHDLGRLWALLVRKLRYARAMRMVMPPSRSSE